MSTQEINEKLAADIMAEIKAHKADRALRMPTVEAALAAQFDAYQRLVELGWRPAESCPKDGSRFLVIEAGNVGQHVCHYLGEWPRGRWWIESDDDLWPSRPILWKALP